MTDPNTYCNTILPHSSCAGKMALLNYIRLDSTLIQSRKQNYSNMLLWNKSKSNAMSFVAGPWKRREKDLTPNREGFFPFLRDPVSESIWS